jgi:hypothetical protein
VSTQKRAFSGSIVLHNQQLRRDSSTLPYTTPDHVRLRRFYATFCVVARSLDTPWNHYTADSGESHPAQMVTCSVVPPVIRSNKRNFPPWVVVTLDPTAVCANACGCVRATRKTHNKKEYENHPAGKNRPLRGKERIRPHKKNKLHRRKLVIITPSLFSECLVFDSRSRSRLLWRWSFVLFDNSSNQMPGVIAYHERLLTSLSPPFHLMQYNAQPKKNY